MVRQQIYLLIVSCFCSALSLNTRLIETERRPHNPYSFYQALAQKQVYELEKKVFPRGCFCRSKKKYYIDSQHVTRQEYKAAKLNLKLRIIQQELAYLKAHKIIAPRRQTDLLIARDLLKSELICALVKEHKLPC